jgi:hypothetical protein
MGSLCKVMHSHDLITLCEVDDDYFGLLSCQEFESSNQRVENTVYLKLQIIHKHEKIPW